MVMAPTPSTCSTLRHRRPTHTLTHMACERVCSFLGGLRYKWILSPLNGTVHTTCFWGGGGVVHGGGWGQWIGGAVSRELSSTLEGGGV
jgi:hypothetical protein